MYRKTATKIDVETAIAEQRLRVDCQKGEVLTRRGEPKADWRPPSLEEVRGLGLPPYHRIAFSCSRGAFRCLLHRIVWFASGQDVPEGFEVNHKNGRKKDCRLSNLELMTRKENIAHAMALGLFDPGKPKNRSITETQVRAIRKRHAAGESQASIAGSLSISRNIVNRVVHRKVYKRVV